MDSNPFLFWLPMIPIAFANATIRELVFIKHFSALRAHQLSTVTLMTLCAVYVWFLFPALDIHQRRQAFAYGFVWMVLTIAFEISLGRFTNKSWTYILGDYDLFAGRIWPIFLVWLLLLPYGVFIIRN